MNTKAQTQRMAIVRNGAKALAPGCAGKAVLRRQQTPIVVHTNRGKIVILIALCLRLVPLNVAHQGVPPKGQQVRRHKAGVLPQGFLRYAGAVAVPAVPPHRRGGCKCLFHTVHLKKPPVTARRHYFLLQFLNHTNVGAKLVQIYLPHQGKTALFVKRLYPALGRHLNARSATAAQFRLCQVHHSPP